MKPRFFYLFLAFLTLFTWPTSRCPAQTSQKKLTYYQKGMTAYNLGQYDKALIDFKEALDDDPDSWEAYQQEGYCYYQLGKPKEMKAAFDESLKRNPENPELKEFIKKIPPPDKKGHSKGKKETKPEATLPETTPTHWGHAPWLNLSTSLDYALLQDLSVSANAWNAILTQYHAPGSGSVANIGFQFALEFGQPLDPQDTLSLSAGFETGHGFHEDLGPSSPVSLTINPQLFLFGLNYYRYFPEASSRFFLTGGVLFGLSVTDYYQNDPTETIQGPLSGNGVGFTFGLGKEWRLASDIGFQLAARFRYLTINKLQNDYLVTTGGSGQAVLATDSQGDIGLASPQAIGQDGLRYATLDYTGLNINFSLNFYWF
ncbi:MAG TPA: tetratricopeptide repeat protein [bacterium]|nr:tetratricopeptide repeat protein [bacterium]